MVDEIWIEDLWGGKGFGFAQLPANGNSGGILLIWDTRMFTCNGENGDERFIGVKESWKGNIEVFLVCIYGPHVTGQKASLWDRISGMMYKWNGTWCIFGDLNVVRCNEDRLNSLASDLGVKVGSVSIKRKLKSYEAMRWELEAEKRNLNDDERTEWLEAIKRWEDKERGCCNMMRQKARIKWDVEGDENLKFFHSFVRRRNNKCNLRGLMVNGKWIEKISEEAAIAPEEKFSDKEVWDAIRGRGGDKAPRPDGFNFKFISEVWEIIKADLIRAISWFWETMEITKDEMPLLWIEACLRSSSMSILVNGSPTEEFGIKRGVRQGDPLSPFLFILAAESLNAIMNEAVANGIFRGVKVGENNVMVSHLQYADDTIFFGQQ
ncbi:RNA-directed DNA polymerase, eukaryota [Tanacetum coccineum]